MIIELIISTTPLSIYSSENIIYFKSCIAVLIPIITYPLQHYPYYKLLRKLIIPL